MSRSKADAVSALDPDTIAANGAFLGARLFLVVAAEPEPVPMAVVISLGRGAIAEQIDAIAAATGICDPDFRRYWGDIIASAVIDTFNALSVRSTSGGSMQ